MLQPEKRIDAAQCLPDSRQPVEKPADTVFFDKSTVDSAESNMHSRN